MNNKENNNPITYTDDGNAVTIRISGDAYANLKTIAKTMNGVSWCETDNTPITVLDNFVLSELEDGLANPTRMYGSVVCGGVGQTADYICESIDTGFDDGTQEHKARYAELRKALLAALPCEKHAARK